VTTNNGQTPPSTEAPPEAAPACWKCGEPASALDPHNSQPVCEQHNPAAAPSDPYDVEALRAAPPEDVATQTIPTVSIRKPKEREFFRCHPSLDYRLDCQIFERQHGVERQSWWVAPGIRPDLAGDLKTIRLFTCMNRTGDIVLWPCRLPSDIGGGNMWYSSALEAAEIAMSAWIRMRPKFSAGGYEVLKAIGDLGEPEWPDKPLKELISIGFKGRTIDRPDHDVIMELRGAL
jgi:hypothetical protein